MPHVGLGGVGWGIERGAFKLQCKPQFKCLCKLGGVGVGVFLFSPRVGGSLEESWTDCCGGR